MSKEDDKERWVKVRKILGLLPSEFRGEITVGFIAWAVGRGVCLSDPLKTESNFAAAWAAWKAGRVDVIHSEHMGRVAAGLDGGCEGPEPVRGRGL